MKRGRGRSLKTLCGAHRWWGGKRPRGVRLFAPPPPPPPPGIRHCVYPVILTYIRRIFCHDCHRHLTSFRKYLSWLSHDDFTWNCDRDILFFFILQFLLIKIKQALQRSSKQWKKKGQSSLIPQEFYITNTCTNTITIQGGPKITERHTSGNKDIKWLVSVDGLSSPEQNDTKISHFG